MAKAQESYLTKREQQIMEIIYRSGQADASTVIEALPDPMSNSAVRTHLRILETKGHLKHAERGGRFIYSPTKPRQRAARAALATVLRTFFDDSVEQVMATLLSDRVSDLTPEELERLRAMIEKARAVDASDAQDVEQKSSTGGN